MYLPTILKRPSTEITQKVYQAQKENPVKGDWINLLNDDLDMLGMAWEDERKKYTSKVQHTYLTKS